MNKGFTQIRGLSFRLLLALFFITSGISSYAQTGYVVNGSAAYLGADTWRLTPNAGSQGGSVWYQNYMSLNFNFDFTFNVYLGNNDGGADGIAFVMQPNSTGAGGVGGGLGYQGITPSLAVEYDTYQNDDPFYDHVAIQPNGNVNTNSGAYQYASARADGGNIEDGLWHTTRIVWDAASNNLKVYFDGSLRLNYTGNIVSTIFGNNPNVYWGFTGATGGASNLQQFGLVSTVFQVAPLAITATSQMNCSGTIGSISSVGSGGYAPLSYSINGGAYGAASDFSNLAPGTYTVTVKDAQGSTKSTTVSLNGFSALQLTAVPSPTSAPGQCNGSVVLTPSGGSAPYTFNEFSSSFSGTTLSATDFVTQGGPFAQNGVLLASGGTNNGWGNSIKTNKIFNRVAGKTFEGSVQINNGYVMIGWSNTSFTGSYNMLAHGLYFYPGGPAEIYEAGSSKGTLNVAGGIVANQWYDFKIELTAGGANYYVRVQGSPAWTWSRSITGYAPATLSLGATYYTAGASYGSFSSDNWNVGGNPATTGLCAGSYTYSVTDANGCTASVTTTVQSGLPVSATASATAASCFGAADGKINIIASGGTAPYNYSINNGGSYSASGSFVGLNSGNYTIRVKDAAGATTTPQVVFVGQPALVSISVSASGATTFCPGGSVTLTASGAGSYSWSNGRTGASILVSETGVYTATGNNGGCATASATIQVTVEDNLAPVPDQASLPAVNGECSATASAPAATDNCAGSVTATTNDPVTYSEQGVYTIHWIFNDGNGNSSSQDQTVVIRDVTAPSITCPASVTLSCQDNTSIEATGSATASDNCSATSISYSDVSTQSADANDAAHYNYTITRTWTATDVTGNRTSCDQTITVQDVTAPAITCPASVTLNCEDNTSIAANGSATGSDICSPVAITSSDVSTQSADINDAAHYNYTITRTWTATDVTGNRTSCDQTITVQDVTAPAITCPASVTLNCQDNTSIAANGSATGSDICSPVSITSSDASTQSADVSDATHYNYTITRTWTATDVTGNHTSCDQIIKVQDVTAPSITCPASVTLNCQDNTSIAANGSATGTDICSPVAITSAEVSTQNADINNAGQYNYTITRTWTATDVTGNHTSCVQVITVQDVTAPVVATPAASLNATVECSNAAGIASTLALAPSATDNCAPVAIHLVSDVTTNACGTTYTRVRKWNFTDITGNTSALFTQTLTVVDLTAPVVTSNFGSVELCYDTTSTFYSVAPVAGTDNCTAVTYSYTVKGSNGSIIRTGSTANASGTFTVGMNTITWTLKDACGNATVATATVRLNAPITGSFNSFTVSGGNPNTIYTSEYAPAASSTITVTAAGGTAPYTYVWSKTGTAANFTVGANPATITATAVSSGTVVFSVVVTDSKGCKAIFRKTINVVDARCGNKMEKVLVCHGTGSASNPWVQICVAPSAVPAQLGNGSYLGACSGSTARTAPKEETPAVKATVLAYPNPSRGIVQVRLTGMTGKVQLSVVDGNGKTHSVREVTVRYSQEDVTLDLQTAASGIYTIRASNGVNLVSTRVVIAR
jgi:hypothetical protein